MKKELFHSLFRFPNTPKMPSAGSGQVQEPRTLPGPIWVKGTEALEPSSALIGCWLVSSAARTQTSILTGDAYLTGDGPIYCDTAKLFHASCSKQAFKNKIFTFCEVIQPCLGINQVQINIYDF